MENKLSDIIGELPNISMQHQSNGKGFKTMKIHRYNKDGFLEQIYCDDSKPPKGWRRGWPRSNG